MSEKELTAQFNRVERTKADTWTFIAFAVLVWAWWAGSTHNGGAPGIHDGVHGLSGREPTGIITSHFSG